VGKYVRGSRVRIRSSRSMGDPYSNMWQYVNLTGEVVSSESVPAYLVKSWAIEAIGAVQMLQVYTVRLDMGVELEGVIEESLELRELPASAR
jgi:hypothetical protein